jgi:glc operon protein GlcG
VDGKFSSRARPSACLADLLQFLPMPLSLEESSRAIVAAQAQAQKIGIRVSVAVVDEGGLLVALSRMDGGPPLSPQIAEAKASGTALTLREGEQMGEIYRDRPGFFAVVGQLTRVPPVPGPGSRLVRKDGRVLGAIGVSGGKPEQDVECAEAGLRAIGS